MARENARENAKGSKAKGTKAKSRKQAPTSAAPANAPADTPAAPSVAAQLPALTPEQIEAAKKKYVSGIMSRGEAVPAGQPLPRGATHEIVGYESDGTPVLKRNRFSMR